MTTRSKRALQICKVASTLARPELSLPTTITRTPIADLKRDPRNPRVHSDRQIDQPLAEFLAEQIRSAKTLLISGGTGTGKTTLLRILANSIPENERILVIEDTPELQIRKLNIVAVGSQTSTFKTNVSFDDLLKDTLRFRPDRIRGSTQH
jgi:Flp pilus assembly CpaF family ATPase